MQQFGAGATKTADFFGQVAANDSFNNFQDGVTKILHGDPNKTVQGPNGPMPDTGYLGLKGRAALDARPGVASAIDNLFKTTRSQLATPDQQLQFDSYSRRYRAAAETDIGSHADQQSTVWYGTVNDATANNALTQVSINATDPVKMATAAADYIGAKVKSAQLAGAQPNDPVWQDTVRQAKQDVLSAQVQSIGATDPATALRILDKNKDIAGTAYDNLYASLRDRAVTQDGDALAQKVHDNYVASTGQSAVRPPATAAGAPAWLDTYYVNIKGSESAGNPNAKSTTSSATGLYQFLTTTWDGLARAHPELGLTPDGRTDPAQQERAVRAFTMDNAKVLAANRVPITPGSLYMSAFFGAGTASTLFDLPPQTLMDNAVSESVLKANSWLRGKSVGEIRQWAQQHAGKGIDTNDGGIGGAAPAIAPDASVAPVDVGHPDDVNALTPTVPEAPSATAAAPTPGAPAAPDATPVPFGTQSAKAQMMQQILDSDATPEVKQRAITVLNQQIAAQQVAADQTAAAKKALSDQTAGVYMTKLLNGETAGMLPAIANDSSLEWNTKSTLTDAVMAHADSSVSGATATYGNGYYGVMKRILAAPDDPNRIADVSSILQMAVPGQNGEAPQLTLAGASKLQTMMTAIQKNPDQAAISETKSSLLKYARSKLSFQQDAPDVPGMKPLTDYQGEQIFNARFVPKFEAAYDKWIASGKDPFEFLTQDNVDKLSQGLRSPGEMAMAKLQAMQTGIDLSNIQVPPAPPGVDGDGWKLVVTSPPVLNNKPLDETAWTGIVQTLTANPTPNTMQWFDSHFVPAGYSSSADVLDVLGVKPAEPKPEAPPKPVDQNDTSDPRSFAFGLPVPGR